MLALIFWNFIIKLLFATGPSPNTRLLVVILISVVLLGIERRSIRLDNFRAALSVLVYPLQLIASFPIQATENIIQYLSLNTSLQQENSVLKQQALIHKIDLLKLKTLEKENIRLRALLEKSFTIGEQVLVAELIAVNQAPYEHRVLVDKGTNFGVHIKQPVLDANGIVGQVTRAFPFSSEVMLMTDPNHALSVEVNRNGLRTIAVGSGKFNQLKLPFLPNNTDILPGDLLITSGLDKTFPRGYPVAIVETVKQQLNKPFAEVIATPVAQLNRSREVLIVWSDSKPVPLTASDEDKPQAQKQQEYKPIIPSDNQLNSDSSNNVATE